MSLLRRFGFATTFDDGGNETLLDAIEQELARLEPRRVELVAAFAALLARVAYADDEITGAEVERMHAVILDHACLSPDEARAVVLVAQNKTVALRGAEDHLLVRRFNDAASEEEKRRLVDCLYAVATADGLVTHVEDREVRRIADALLLPKSAVLEIRGRYREKLEELEALRKLRGGAAPR